MNVSFIVLMGKLIAIGEVRAVRQTARQMARQVATDVITNHVKKMVRSLVMVKTILVPILHTATKICIVTSAIKTKQKN